MESRRAHQWLSGALQLITIYPCELSDLTTSEKFTILGPPLQIGPTMVFRLTLSGLNFQTKEKIFLLTSFTKSTGTFDMEQLYTSLARAKFLMMAILPRIVKHLTKYLELF